MDRFRCKQLVHVRIGEAKNLRRQVYRRDVWKIQSLHLALIGIFQSRNTTKRTESFTFSNEPDNVFSEQHEVRSDSTIDMVSTLNSDHADAWNVPQTGLIKGQTAQRTNQMQLQAR